ncbi:MAG: hypothetical protein OXI07_09650 [Gammaproteobacteria bacterium]|nr:hypothetical protein [Gammaproteobacteria bacterium]
MFHPDHDFGAPSGGDRLLAELGVRPELVREIAEDARAIRCPDRGADYPAYGFASLFPDPSLAPGLHEDGPPDRCPGQADEPWDPAPLLPPAE